MPKKVAPRSYDEILNLFRSSQFDVQPVPGVANHAQVSKYGAAAVIAPGPGGKGVALVTKPGLVFNGEIAHLLDRGFQKFFRTSHFELPATAERLRTEHKFSEEFGEIVGEISLYNESLGTVSDEYMYDRVKGRDHDGLKKAGAPWDTAAH